MREEVSEERGAEQQPGNDLPDHPRLAQPPVSCPGRTWKPQEKPAKIEKKERCYARVKGLKLAIAATSSAASIGLEMCI